MKNKKLREKYVDLMTRADSCTSRKDALVLIHKATKLMEKISTPHH